MQVNKNPKNTKFAFLMGQDLLKQMVYDSLKYRWLSYCIFLFCLFLFPPSFYSLLLYYFRQRCVLFMGTTVTHNKSRKSSRLIRLSWKHLFVVLTIPELQATQRIIYHVICNLPLFMGAVCMYLFLRCIHPSVVY